jgi:hypothetical protein
MRSSPFFRGRLGGGVIVPVKGPGPACCHSAVGHRRPEGPLTRLGLRPIHPLPEGARNKSRACAA